MNGSNAHVAAEPFIFCGKIKPTLSGRLSKHVSYCSYISPWSWNEKYLSSPIIIWSVNLMFIILAAFQILSVNVLSA